MNKRIAILIVLLLALGVSAGFAGTAFKVNNKDVQEGETLMLFKEDLEGSKMVFSLPIPEGISSAEISLDNGRQWDKMEKDGNLFVYTHRPTGDENIRVAFLFKNGGGKMKTHSTNTTIIFQRNRPEDAIMLLLEKFKDAYEAENKSRFMDFFSMRFPDRIKFEESIQNDFYNYNNIRLFYRIDRSTFDPEYKGGIWDIYWERKYTDRNGNNFSDSANITFSFVREADTWLINGMRNNTLFGSSLLASPDLTISTSDISGGYVGPNYFINAVIHNNGPAAANNFMVQFNYPHAPTPIGLENVTVIPANSMVTVSHNYGALVPGAGDSVTVTIDPNNTVSENNEGNNAATKNFPF